MRTRFEDMTEGEMRTYCSKFTNHRIDVLSASRFIGLDGSAISFPGLCIQFTEERAGIGVYRTKYVEIQEWLEAHDVFKARDVWREDKLESLTVEKIQKDQEENPGSPVKEISCRKCGKIYILGGSLVTHERKCRVKPK